jgi:hypothetical protein
MLPPTTLSLALRAFSFASYWMSPLTREERTAAENRGAGHPGLLAG